MKKSCRGCFKLLKLEEFSPDKKNKGGLNGQCKACVQQKRKDIRKARLAGVITTLDVSYKQCTKCASPKPISEFYKESGNPDGYANKCKEHKDELTAIWRFKNREHVNKVASNSAKKPLRKLKNKLRKYGLTTEQYFKMKVDQDNKCKICLAPPPKGKELVIDHNKITNVVRGLLCYICNRDLHLLDKEGKLMKAAEYVNNSVDHKLEEKIKWSKYIFEKAVSSGELSLNENSDTYIGNFELIKIKEGLAMLESTCGTKYVGIDMRSELGWK